MNNKYKNGSISQTLEGAFKVAVIDAKTNDIIWEQPEFQKNLILNTGMNQVAYTAYAGLITHGIAGTGSRANKVSGGSATVSQNGTTLTLSPDPSFLGFTGSLYGYPSSLESGDVIVFDVGSGGVNNIMVSSSIVGNSCNTYKSAVIPSTTFTIWKTSQRNLHSEYKRAGSNIPNSQVVTGADYCNSIYIPQSASMVMQKTWDFAPESSLITYNEVGAGWSYTSLSNTIFSRLLLESPLIVDINQKIRLTYQIKVSVGPTTASARPDAYVAGWTVNSPSGSTTMGSESIQGVDTYGLYGGVGLSRINANGDSTGIPTLEPSCVGSYCSFFISNSSASLSNFNTSSNRGGSSANIAGSGDGGTATYQSAYVNNSFTVNKIAVHGLYLMNRNDIRSMGFGAYDYNGNGYTQPWDAGNNAYCFVFNTPQSKSNTQILTVAYTWTWDRNYVA